MKTYRFSYQLQAFYSKVIVVKGVRKNVGDYVAGEIAWGRNILDPKTFIRSTDNSKEEVLKIINIIWKEFYPGYFKEICIKEHGEIIYFHSNFIVIKNVMKAKK